MNNRLNILRLTRESSARGAVALGAALALALAACNNSPVRVARDAVAPPATPPTPAVRVLDARRAEVAWPAVAGARRYRIAWSNTPALDPARARHVNVPARAAPGDLERDTLAIARAGRALSVAVAAVDARGARSALSSATTVFVPGARVTVRCRALDGAPLSGVPVELSAARVRTVPTDSGGIARFDDVAAGAAIVRIDEAAWHRVIARAALTGDTSLSFVLVPVTPLPGGAFGSVLGGVMSTSDDVGIDGVLRRWRRRPVDVYVPADTNAAGVDYGAEARAALARWNARTGLGLFRPVATPPDTGVVLHYDPPAQMNGQNGFMVPTLDAAGFPVRGDIHVVDTFADRERLYRILLHELGHTIRLGHLPAGFIMYAGQPLPPDITDAEVEIVRLHEALPNGTDLSVYRLRAGE